MKMCVHSITAFMTAVASGGALRQLATERVAAAVSHSLSSYSSRSHSFACDALCFSEPLLLQCLRLPSLTNNVSVWWAAFYLLRVNKWFFVIAKCYRWCLVWREAMTLSVGETFYYAGAALLCPFHTFLFLQEQSYCSKVSVPSSRAC